jgi:hypothetical protein
MEIGSREALDDAFFHLIESPDPSFTADETLGFLQEIGVLWRSPEKFTN